MQKTGLNPFLELSEKARCWVAHEFGLQPADAADVVQRVLIRIWRWPPVEEVRHPKAYLYKACAREAWDLKRRAARHAGTVPLDAVRGRAADASDDAAVDGDDPRIAMLSAKRLEVVSLMVEGYTQAEAARALGLKPVTVRARVSEMREIFRRKFGVQGAA